MKWRRTKKKRFEDETLPALRTILLWVLALAFLFAAVLSLYSILKTKEIIQHPGIYKKQREYACSEEDEEGTTRGTGSRQVISFDPQVLESAKKSWSNEVNPNPKFELTNINEPLLPVGYRNTTVSQANASFLHNKIDSSINTNAIIKADDPAARAGWFMEFFTVERSKQYFFETSYMLSEAKAVVVAEEVDSAGVSTYSDLFILSPASSRANKQILFVPRVSTVKMRFYTQLTSSGAVSIYQESVRAISNAQLNEPLVSVSFDDGWKTVYDEGKPVLDELKVKTTQFIIAESFRDLLAGYMNLNEVKHMSKDGHEIASHSLRHCNIAKLDKANVEYDLAASKRTLETEFKPIKGFAYPYGSYTAETEQAAKKYYDYVRTTDTGYDSLLSDRYALRSVTITPDISMEEFKQIVDFASVNKLWLDVVYHKIDSSPESYGVSAAVLKEQLKYIQSKNIKIMTVGAAVETLRNQQKAAYGIK